MFSQFRHAVETFAPQPRRSTDDGGHIDGRASPHSRSQSTDVSSTSPTQLAESPLSALRKSFSPQSPTVPNSPQKPRPYKSTLEERLRAAAAFSIGEASNSTTPQASARVSPTPTASIKDIPLSPSSTPLPESPIITPSHDPLGVAPLSQEPSKLKASLSSESDSAFDEPREESVKIEESMAEANTEANAAGGKEDVEIAAEQSKAAAMRESVTEEAIVEEVAVPETTEETSSLAQIQEDHSTSTTTTEESPSPTPVTTIEEESSSVGEKAQASEDPSASITTTLDIPSPASITTTEEPCLKEQVQEVSATSTTTTTTVEELQERLKLVEQRFTGMWYDICMLS